MAAEAGLVDAAEEGQLAFERRCGRCCEAGRLRQRLHHQHAGQRGAAWEVAGEEVFVASQVPQGHAALAGVEFDDLVDEQERRPVRQQLLRTRESGIAHGVEASAA